MSLVFNAPLYILNEDNFYQQTTNEGKFSVYLPSLKERK